MASSSCSCQTCAPGWRSFLSNQTFSFRSRAAGAPSRRCLSLRAASVSEPAWLRNRRGAPCSDILAIPAARSGWLGLLCGRWLAAPVLPINLLLLSDDGLYRFHKAQIRLVLVHVAVGARPVHIEPLLALHPLRGGAVPGPGLAIAADALPALNQDNSSAQGGRDDRHPRSRREDLHEGGHCARADHEQAEDLRALFVGGSAITVPAPLSFEVLLEIL